MNRHENKKYILNKINQAAVTDKPWRHLIIHDFLPEDLYNGIKNETSEYLKRKELIGTENKGIRAYHINVNSSVGVMPRKDQEYLIEYYSLLQDYEIESAIKEKVNTVHHSNKKSVDMWSSFDIQSSGFVYDEVHCDHPLKTLTMLLYLADVGDDLNLGTMLYTPEKLGRNLSVEKDYLERADFLPNLALFFAPCDIKGSITNHSMMHLSKITDFRKSIQTFWLREKVNWTKPQKGRIELK